MRENISAFINSRRFIAVFAILTIMFGGLWMAHTQMNRIPDLWEHVYRVSGITNGDIVARPVTSVSDYHRIAADNYGGKVDWQWINLSDQHRDPFDAGVVQLDSITASDDIGADVPYNNTAVYSPNIILTANIWILSWKVSRARSSHHLLPVGVHHAARIHHPNHMGYRAVATLPAPHDCVTAFATGHLPLFIRHIRR